MARSIGAVIVALIASAIPVSARVIRVHSGGSIQAAVDAASPGDIVAVGRGTCREAGRPCPTNPANTCAVVVDKDGITITGPPFGLGGVVLENPGGQATGPIPIRA
jgi:hypothetical protein